jgi:hypothetical protein
VNSIFALVLIVKSFMVASLASLAFVNVAPVGDVQPPTQLDVVGVDSAECDHMGGRWLADTLVCADVDY